MKLRGQQSSFPHLLRYSLAMSLYFNDKGVPTARTISHLDVIIPQKIKKIQALAEFDNRFFDRKPMVL